MGLLTFPILYLNHKQHCHIMLNFQSPKNWTSSPPISVSLSLCQVWIATGRCSTLLMIMRFAVWTQACLTGCTSRPSRATPTCASMPWTCTWRPTASSGPTGTRAASPPSSFPPHPHLHHPAPRPTLIATHGRARERSPTSWYLLQADTVC